VFLELTLFGHMYTDTRKYETDIFINVHFQKCGIATQTAKKANVIFSRSTEVKTAVLSNKLVVASVDSSSPIATVSVLFR